MTTDFLAVRGIRKSFGPVEVLHGVDLNLAAGTITALLGENGAGKSTFVRILAGDHRPDDGTITVDGKASSFHSVSDAREAGIRLIAQEIADAPTLTVAENIVLGAWPTRGGLLDRRAMLRMAQEALNLLGAELPLTAKVANLRLGERQIIEIARATIGASKCIIFDEATAALSDVEARKLFQLIRRLAERGAAVLYITHRLDEVFALADRVCVLRDGRVSLDRPTPEINQEQVIEAMVGRAVAHARHSLPAPQSTAEPALEAERLGSDAFSDISFTLRPGEILGMYGKVGSGVQELSASLVGARQFDSGRLLVDGKPKHFRHPAEAIAASIGHLPADRATEGLLRTMSLAENLSAPSWSRLARHGMLSRERLSSAYSRWHRELRVKADPSGNQRITELSGGNQQKVLLGRWLEAGSRILVLTEPTRGVDVGARQEIYRVLAELAAKGHAIIIATSDYEDINAVASRALILVRGQMIAEIPHDRISTESLTEAAGGGVHA
ncbi:sugar ABC transporter ATP-binding protein [Rhizobium sp. Root708]|uniref:sugar ABC transporter ATP-binding protein n=1 Tax=Rhizobium sp. Root708 TaxID=1736592 RepID=UPI0006F4DB23|nr:sugar ABC transporter ATP-binding protein [Rhizobium sp. Root708]KRB54496.1 sugar ABC transporter ATP-binding protein [Rhizobium sp. Root708]